MPAEIIISAHAHQRMRRRKICIDEVKQIIQYGIRYEDPIGKSVIYALQSKALVLAADESKVITAMRGGFPKPQWFQSNGGSDQTLGECFKS